MASQPDKSKVHKLSLKGNLSLPWHSYDVSDSACVGSSKLVAEFVSTCLSEPGIEGNPIADTSGSLNTRLTPSCELHLNFVPSEPLTSLRFQRGVYPAEDFTAYETQVYHVMAGVNSILLG